MRLAQGLCANGLNIFLVFVLMGNSRSGLDLSVSTQLLILKINTKDKCNQNRDNVSMRWCIFRRGDLVVVGGGVGVGGSGDVC